MPVTIVAAPTVVPGPAFAGTTIRVPLSESPNPAWLRRLVAETLPGKGHRVVEDGIEFFLDRDSRDVLAALRKIADAIAAADKAHEEGREEEEERAARAEQQTAARVERINGQLAEWWEQRAASVRSEDHGSSGGSSDG